MAGDHVANPSFNAQFQLRERRLRFRRESRGFQTITALMIVAESSSPSSRCFQRFVYAWVQMAYWTYQHCSGTADPCKIVFT
jgi:hypothetical protein